MAKIVASPEPEANTERVLVNAAIARHMLSFNKPHVPGVAGTNRKISKRAVTKYAQAMLRDEWKLTHQGIAFLKDGSLDDGQHRLLAILLAAETNPDIAVWMMVTSGLEHGIFKYIDMGMRRRLADTLSAEGIKDGFQVSATSRLFYCYLNVKWAGRTSWTGFEDFSGDLMLETISKYPSIIEAVTRARNNRVPGNVSAMSCGYALACELRPDIDVNAYQRKLETGLGYEDYFGSAELDPAYQVRERIMAKEREGKGNDRIEQLAWWIKGFNKYVNGQEMRQLKFSPNETFPRIQMASQEGPEGDA